MARLYSGIIQHCVFSCFQGKISVYRIYTEAVFRSTVICFFISKREMITRQSWWSHFILKIGTFFIISQQILLSIEWKCLSKGSQNRQKWMKRLMTFLLVIRNVVVLVVSALIAFSLNGPNQPFILTGKVTPGLPPVKVPDFSTTIDNRVWENDCVLILIDVSLLFSFRLSFLLTCSKISVPVCLCFLSLLH